MRLYGPVSCTEGIEVWTDITQDPTADPQQIVAQLDQHLSEDTRAGGAYFTVCDTVSDPTAGRTISYRTILEKWPYQVDEVHDALCAVIGPQPGSYWNRFALSDMVREPDGQKRVVDHAGLPRL